MVANGENSRKRWKNTNKSECTSIERETIGSGSN